MKFRRACLIQGVQGSFPWRLKTPLSRGGGGNSHMKQAGMLVGNFEFNP